jgi:hypothetical protein
MSGIPDIVLKLGHFKRHVRRRPHQTMVAAPAPDQHE